MPATTRWPAWWMRDPRAGLDAYRVGNDRRLRPCPEGATAFSIYCVQPPPLSCAQIPPEVEKTHETSKNRARAPERHLGHEGTRHACSLGACEVTGDIARHRQSEGAINPGISPVP